MASISHYIPNNNNNKLFRYFNVHSFNSISYLLVPHAPLPKTLHLPQNQTFFSSTKYPSLSFYRQYISSCFQSFPLLNCSNNDVRKTNYSNFNRFYSSDSKQVYDIAQIIRNADTHLECKLKSMNLRLSVYSAIRILKVLNTLRVSAVVFFHWVRQLGPEFEVDCDICSLVIDNCGRLNDFDTMCSLMNEFRMNGIQLNEKAFGFLAFVVLNKNSGKGCDSEKEVLKRLIDVLKKADQGSAIRVLIEWLSIRGNFEMARFVIENAERKVSYYNILMREKCRRSNFKGATDMLHEMKKVNCGPNLQTYNYVLSVLCKCGKMEEAFQTIDLMSENNCLPSALSFEILMHKLCSLDNLHIALEILDKMTLYGIKPRLSTHAMFIKVYFNSERYVEAYDYVVVSGEKYKSSSNMIYSLLASLYLKNSNVAEAYTILHKMSEKGLRPYFSVYTSVLKHLQKSGRGNLVGELKRKFTGMGLESNKDTR
ncbi:hypothetical protein ACFE04_015580 [Oxalis oulophora]